MTNKQEIKFKMQLTVEEFLVKNESVTKDLPEYSDIFSKFRNNISQIKLVDELHKNVKTGIAKDKKEIKNNLINLATENSGKVFAYATVKENKQLMDEVNFSMSEVGRMTDVAIRTFAEGLYKKIETMLETLANYGINAETQKTFVEAIAAYNNSIAKPRVGIAEKREATKELEKLFAASEKFLNKLDAIMFVIRFKEVNFYNGYKTVRRLVDIGPGNVAVKATAKDIVTGEPLKGAIFTFKPDDGAEAMNVSRIEVTKTTATKGSFQIKNLVPGTYKVTVKMSGYKSKEITVSVLDNARSDIEVQLEKA